MFTGKSAQSRSPSESLTLEMLRWEGDGVSADLTGHKPGHGGYA